MKKAAVIFAAALTGLTQSQAALLVYESFADTTGGQSINGYQTTTSGYSTGLSGTWSLQGGSNQALTQNTSSDWNVAQSTNGYSIEQNGGNYHYWEASGGAWAAQRAQSTLGSTIDMSNNGTWYLSFFFKGGNIDSLFQAGLNDGTTELMVGQGYGANGTTQGVDAWYQTIGANPAGTSSVNPPFSTWTAQFLVAKFEKTDSGNTDSLAVSFINYNLGSTSTIDLSDPTSWLYTETITGVDNTFTNLQLKVGGPNGNYPAIDEIRVGETWADVTGVIPEPSSALLGGLGLLALLRRRRA